MSAQSDVLRLVDFGSDVAENDAGLSEYFIETTDFSTILSGKVDVIRGHKGLGKSAIYRTLLSGKHVPSNVVVVSASEATSSELFRATQSSVTTEDQFRLLWTAYLSSVIANKTIEVISETPGNRSALKEIREFLKALGLSKDARPGGLMDAIRRTKSFGVGMGMSEEGIPSLNFNVEFDNKSERILLSEEHFIRLISMCADVVRMASKRMWVLIDRLDELFQKNSQNETLSLRALFRSHLNICAINQGQVDIRCKIFIRSDIYERITKKQGFTNVTHLRDLNIIWNARSIVALVSRRVISSNEISRILRSKGVKTEDPNAVWNFVVPDKIQGKGSPIWIAKATMDGLGAFNPRNYITLLSLSAKRNLELQKNNPTGINFDYVLSTDSILSSFGELSRKRLDDTVLAEFSECRPYIDRLRGGVASFESLAELSEALGIEVADSETLESAIELLIESGVLRRVTHSTFSVAYLYRPALKAGNVARSPEGDVAGTPNNSLQGRRP